MAKKKAQRSPKLMSLSDGPMMPKLARDGGSNAAQAEQDAKAKAKAEPKAKAERFEVGRAHQVYLTNFHGVMPQGQLLERNQYTPTNWDRLMGLKDELKLKEV